MHVHRLIQIHQIKNVTKFNQARFVQSTPHQNSRYTVYWWFYWQEYQKWLISATNFNGETKYTVEHTNCWWSSGTVQMYSGAKLPTAVSGAQTYKELCLARSEERGDAAGSSQEETAVPESQLTSTSVYLGKE